MRLQISKWRLGGVSLGIRRLGGVSLGIRDSSKVMKKRQKSTVMAEFAFLNVRTFSATTIW